MSEDTEIYTSIEEFVDAVRRAVARVASGAEELRSRLRGLIRRYSCRGEGGFNAVVVDTAYPPAPLDMLGVSVSIIGCAVLGVRSGRLAYRDTRHVILASKHGLSQDTVAAYARLLERREAMRVLVEDGYDTVVFDGEVAPYRCIFGRPTGPWRKYCPDIIGVLEDIAARSTALVGVIKRSYSSILSLYGVNLADKHAASLVLRRGEYMCVNRVRAGGIEVVEAYYKPLRGLPLAVKVEVGGATVDDDTVLRVVSELGCSASATGLPFYIDLVDALARRELRLVDALRRHLASRLPGGVLLPTNPQKSYLEGRL